MFYALAFILDPRAKLDKFDNVIGLLAEAINVNNASYFSIS